MRDSWRRESSARHSGLGGDGGDLCLGTSGERESNHCRTAQIVEREPDDASAFAALPHDARNPSEVQGLPSLLVRIMVLRFSVASSAT